MGFTDTQKAEISKAVSDTALLIDAFKYIISMSGTNDKDKEEIFKYVEPIISDSRKQIFYFDWADKEWEKDMPYEGFFTRYVRPSTHRYNAQDYSEPLKKLSRWLKIVQFKANHPEFNLDKQLDIQNISRATLGPIYERVVIDGGKNAYKILDGSKKQDIEDARERVARKIAYRLKQEWIENLKHDPAEEEMATMKKSIDQKTKEQMDAEPGLILKYIAKNDKNIRIKIEDFKKREAEYFASLRGKDEEKMTPLLKTEEQYLAAINYTVNRRKDVLQALVLQMGENVATIKNILQSQEVGPSQPAIITSPSR